MLAVDSYDGIPIADFDNAKSYRWVIASASDGILGFDPAKIAIDSSGFVNALNGGRFSVVQSGNNIDLVYAVPEPSVLALLAAGLLGLLVWRVGPFCRKGPMRQGLPSKWTFLGGSARLGPSRQEGPTGPTRSACPTAKWGVRIVLAVLLAVVARLPVRGQALQTLLSFSGSTGISWGAPMGP